MTSLRGKSAVVLGGGPGVGKVTVKALVSDGVRVTAVARSADRLRALKAEASDGLVTLQGVTPRMGRLDEFDLESFSAAWDVDVKAAFLLIKQALTLPLAPGSTVVVVSSGAAIDGSPLSGGYAGAKRMEWLLADYAQKVSDAKELGIRFLAVLPRPIEGTTIGARAASAYSAMRGITAEVFMERVGVSLDRSPPQS
jgi:NAD(P)-dependent dehydrogenase (short-subunit alcohol dehydrogenase family)